MISQVPHILFLGSRPAKRAFDKSLIRARHEEEILRFGSNPEKRIIDWYVPPKRFNDPIEQEVEGRWRIKRTM